MVDSGCGGFLEANGIAFLERSPLLSNVGLLLSVDVKAIIFLARPLFPSLTNAVLHRNRMKR